MKSFQIKCSPDDPPSANLISSSSDTFITFWVSVELVNLSLETGSTEGLRNEMIPLIKEQSALTDTDNFKNYRPVSNLLFVSKLIERVVAMDIKSTIQQNIYY